MKLNYCTIDFSIWSKVSSLSITFGSQDIIPKDVSLFQDEINELQEDLSAMLKAVITLLDGAKYLWQDELPGTHNI